MQSQPERLVMENLCTSSPLLPPHLINNTLIYYLHFEVFLHGNLKQGEKERLIVHPLSVFSITTSAMDHLSVSLAHYGICVTAKRWNHAALRKSNSIFWPWLSLADAKQTIQSGGFAWHLRIKKIIFPALTSGAFNTNPGLKKSIVIQANWSPL